MLQDKDSSVDRFIWACCKKGIFSAVIRIAIMSDLGFSFAGMPSSPYTSNSQKVLDGGSTEPSSSAAGMTPASSRAAAAPTTIHPDRVNFKVESFLLHSFAQSNPVIITWCVRHIEKLCSIQNCPYRIALTLRCYLAYLVHIVT